MKLPGNMASRYHRGAWWTATSTLMLVGLIIMLLVSEVAPDLMWSVMANPDGVCVGYIGGMITGMMHPYRDGTCPVLAIEGWEYKHTAENPAKPNVYVVLAGALVLAPSLVLTHFLARAIIRHKSGAAVQRP